MAVGIDIVHVPAFTEQLELPGSQFTRVFTERELRRASSHANRSLHLAGRWAAKEALVKAWAQSRYGLPPLIDEESFDFAQIEVVPDRWGRVAYQFHGEVARLLGDVCTNLSISHDGEYAVAYCELS